MQKRQRYVADQRYDLPYYVSQMDFIAEEFYKYYKEFINVDNKIIQNWEVIDNGGLQVKVNSVTDSLLLNAERTGFENLVYRAAGAIDLTVDLQDNLTNYVELEITSGTTGTDSVTLWDATANSGVGAEFIQSVDTVTCTAEVALISNTISFSSQANRIPLAEVLTSAGSISTITDVRDFLWHLDSNWNFGSPRTDKTIVTLKNDSDAIKTIIKEMKGTTAWYTAQGVSTLNLLERMNYILTDGGTISWDLPKPSVGSLIAVASDPNTGIADGDTVTLHDGISPYVFEFDTDSSGPTNAITIPLEGTPAQVKTAIIAAITGAAINMTATSGVGDRIELSNDSNGTSGDQAIAENISNGASLSPYGMLEGYDNTQLTWDADLKLIAPSRSFYYTISAQTVSNILDGEMIYVTLPDVGTAPGGPLTVFKTTSASYVLDELNTRGYIIGYRSGSKIYFGNGWQSVELEDGESNQLGDGISGEWMTATGLVSEYDSTPPYTSNHWITPATSFTQGMSELDSIVETIYNMVVGPSYDEFVISDGTATYSAGAKITLPAPFGLGSAQTYQTGLRQLEVFFNGRKADAGVGNDWLEDANLGAGIGNQIELIYDIPNLTKISFRIQTGGGQDGTVGVDAPNIYDEGALIASTVGKIDFTGKAVTASLTAPNESEVHIQYPRELGKSVKNNTGSPIAANKIVAWADDGTMVLADANTASLSDIIGATAAIIADGNFGIVVREGSCVGLTTGLGATVGASVYLGETPGEVSLTAPPAIGDTVIRLGRAEPADGVASATCTDLWLHPEVIAEP